MSASSAVAADSSVPVPSNDASVVSTAPYVFQEEYEVSEDEIKTATQTLGADQLAKLRSSLLQQYGLHLSERGIAVCMVKSNASTPPSADSIWQQAINVS